jgi:hypothetical protein
MSAASPHSLRPSDETHSIEILTQEALEASQAGDWDRVAACYASRGTGLQRPIADRALAHRIMAIDAQVRAAALVAQTGIASLLAENVQVKHQLRRLRESAGHLLATEGTIHREA